MISIELFPFEIGCLWVFLVLLTTLIGIFRTLTDRIRSGLVIIPEDQSKASKLINEFLHLGTHQRPLHIEAAMFCSLQVIIGFLFFQGLMNNTFQFEKIVTWACSLLVVVLIERLSSWLYPLRISQSSLLNFHLALGIFPVKIMRLFCLPLTWFLYKIEEKLQSSNQKIIIEKEEESELADHIRTVSREGPSLDPDILEIMGNTIEMSHLKVKDVMIPRNQVQILNIENPYFQNLEIAKSCGHTRLPLCVGDLDQCLGIIHLKYAFRELSNDVPEFDLKKITKAPARLDSEEPLPVALKRMMKLKVHMALVRDEFGGIDGVITLEDILEEVVGEIQDEFDSDEKSIEKINHAAWKVSGMVPVHELPSEIRYFDEADDLATIGGQVTKKLGRIPEKGEEIRISNLSITILEADETRVLTMKVETFETRVETFTSLEKE